MVVDLSIVLTSVSYDIQGNIWPVRGSFFQTNCILQQKEVSIPLLLLYFLFHQNDGKRPLLNYVRAYIIRPSFT